MREKPIIFNAQMVRAILEGRKTQTRRMMKPQPELRMGGFWHWKDCQWADGGIGFPKTGIEDHAPYQPGDRLWVRETFSEHPEQAIMAYRADGEEFEDADGWLWEPKWTPSIHMPRKFSRITLEVTDVRAERLQDISPADCIEEGARAFGGGDKPIDAYRALWTAIYSPGSWGANPWVWVICFRVLDVKKWMLS